MMNGLGLGLGRSLSSSTGGGGGTAPSGPAPTNFQVTSRSVTTLNITWDGDRDIPGGQYWRVEIQAAGGNWSSPLFDVPNVSQNEYFFADASPNTAYDFRVRLSILDGEYVTESSFGYLDSEYSLPEIPADVLCFGFPEGYVQVVWTPQSDVGYQIIRNGSQIQDVGMAGSCNDFGAAPGENYYYEVQAYGWTSLLQASGLSAPPATGSWNP